MSPASIAVLYVCVTSVLTLAKVIDLSHQHGPNTFMAPGSASYNRTVVGAGYFLPEVYIELADLKTGEHGGTHMDAPSHFVKGGRTIENIPLENLLVDGVMIDCSQDVNGDENYVLPLLKILEWESQNGMIPDGAGVVINFGWSSRFSKPSEYVNSKTVDDFTTFQFPIISEEAAKHLIHDRNVKIVAVDTASPDLPEVQFKVHRLVLGNDRVVVENVRDPGRLPARGFRLHAAPVAFVGASGTQVRFFAVTDDDDYFSNYNGGQSSTVVSILSIAMSAIFLTIVNYFQKV